MLDAKGRVVGIIGGSLIPAARFDPRHMNVSPSVGLAGSQVNAATPIPALQTVAGNPSSLDDLLAKDIVAAPLSDMDGLLYVGTFLEMPKTASEPLPRDVGEFSRRDKQVWVLSEWQKKGKISKGIISAKVYDEQNRLRVVVDPKKTSLQSTPMRSGFAFAPTGLDAGIYRIDLLWDESQCGGRLFE
jgi:hypothetical protein